MALLGLGTRTGSRKATEFLLPALALVVVVVGALAVGGSESGVLQLAAVPVVWFAAMWGTRAGLLFGGIAGLALAFVPFDIAAGEAQTVGRRAFRIVVLVGLVWFTGYLKSRFTSFVEARSRFLSTVSHELRTPLTSVVGFSESLWDQRREVGNSVLVELIGFIRSEGFHASHILDQMILAARLDTGQLVVDQERIDLRAVLTGVIENLPPIGQSVDITVEGRAEAMADPLRTRQILRNLIIHAAESDHGQVSIRLTTDDDTAHLDLAHPGGSLSDEGRSYMFAPLFDPRPQRNQPIGKWLPLSVSRQLARLMGGDIDYGFEDDTSTFRLRLPTVV